VRAQAGRAWWLASQLLLDEATWIPEGAICVERGKVLAVRRGAPRRRGPVVDLRPWVLLPGLVDAHAHLDLTHAPRPRRGARFVPWLRRVVAARPRTDAAASVRDGARRLLAAGATTVVDVDGSGASRRALSSLPLRAAVLREFIALRPGRAAGELRRARSWIGSMRRTDRLVAGFAPHAPYSVSLLLYAGLARIARRRRAPLSTHLAESEEEIEFVEEGGGPLRAFLEERRAIDPGERGPRRRPLEILEEARFLGPRTLLAHANELARGEVERLARSGSTVVLCPGTHLYFARSDFPAKRLERAGVRLALGTDGLVSNDGLDLFLEMARARSLEPALRPEAVFRAATRGGAGPLGLEGRIGTLRPGGFADAVAVEPPGAGGGREALLDYLTGHRPVVRAVFVGGRAAAGWRIDPEAL
jgi:cytosine/adenosine deaminase-related metal-dependent hydrolase